MEMKTEMELYIAYVNMRTKLLLFYLKLSLSYRFGFLRNKIQTDGQKTGRDRTYFASFYVPNKFVIVEAG